MPSPESQIPEGTSIKGHVLFTVYAEVRLQPDYLFNISPLGGKILGFECQTLSDAKFGSAKFANMWLFEPDMKIPGQLAIDVTRVEEFADFVITPESPGDEGGVK